MYIKLFESIPRAVTDGLSAQPRAVYPRLGAAGYWKMQPRAIGAAGDFSDEHCAKSRPLKQGLFPSVRGITLYAKEQADGANKQTALLKFEYFDVKITSRRQRR